MKPERRILIIEDNPDDETLLLRQLKMAQLEKHVRVIQNGVRAMTYVTNPRCRCENLAAVFLDLKLPGASGLDVLRQIRASDRLCNLPVIVMTSSNSPDESEECRNLRSSCSCKSRLPFPHLRRHSLTFSTRAKRCPAKRWCTANGVPLGHDVLEGALQGFVPKYFLDGFKLFGELRDLELNQISLVLSFTNCPRRARPNLVILDNDCNVQVSTYSD